MTETVPTPDDRPNKDWLQVWYGNCHSNIQWAKGQSWNAVQWSVLLLAAISAASKEYAAVCVWTVFAILIAMASTCWLFDLHSYARRERETASRLVKPLKEVDIYLPKKRVDSNHLRLLVVRVAVVIGAAIATICLVLKG